MDVRELESIRWQERFIVARRNAVEFMTHHPMKNANECWLNSMQEMKQIRSLSLTLT